MSQGAETAKKPMKKHVLQWHILHRCNLRCTHCYQEDYAAECTGAQRMQLYGQYLNFCKANGFRGHINFTGGEPLLSPDLFELLKRCDADGISCGILTNGTLIDRETAARLGTIRSLSFVQVSIDGTRETHDRVRGKGNFDKAFAGLKLLRRQGIQTMAAFTCHKGNYRTLPQVIRTVRRKGIDRFWADRLIPMGSSREDVLSTEEFRTVVQCLTKAHTGKHLFSHTDVHINRAMQFLEGGGCYYQCAAGDTLLTLLADGTLLPCIRLPIPIGNCLETDMLTLWQNSPLIAELRAHEIPQDCICCPKAEFCRGGAKCLSYAVTGDWHRKDINCYYR